MKYVSLLATNAMLLAAVGCMSTGNKSPLPVATTASASSIPVSSGAGPIVDSNRGATPVAYTVPVPPSSIQNTDQGPGAGVRERAPGEMAEPLVESAELLCDALVAEVQRRNPALQAASAAYRSSAARITQQSSLEDPMFETMLGPAGLGDDGGWMVQLSQKYPWFGKRRLRGLAAAAEADSMRGDIGEKRVMLAEATRMAYYDYYLSHRLAEVNATTLTLLTNFREIAKSKYEVNQATEQDILQTDVELAKIQTRTTEFRRNQQVAAARINTLLHRPPHCNLPLPPAKLTLPEALPNVAIYQETALRNRPDLYAQYARVRTEEANLELAYKEYYPDIDVRAKYDAFMPEDMRAQVGVAVNLPVRCDRRAAAVREASEKLQQRRWEYQNLLDTARFEVQSAYERAVQARVAVVLLETKILPASERNLESAQANYTSGKIDFLRLIDAERQLNEQREMYQQAIAECHQQLAELERSVGEMATGK